MIVDIKRMRSLIEDAGYEPRSYSGRAMYGAECMGVTLARGTSVTDFFADLLDQVINSGEEEGQLEELVFMMRETRTDQMGLGIIAYWPELREPKDDVEHEGEEG